MERGSGTGGEDESGRVARFRRRFGGADTASAVAAEEGGLEAEDGGGDKASARPASQEEFSAEDYDWMSAGGRAARGGQAPAPKAAEPAKPKAKGK